MIKYLHKEGNFILSTLLAFLLVVTLIAWWQLGTGTGFVIIAISNIIVFLAVASFFRNPRRQVTCDANCITAPADGKVVVIEETFEPEYFKDKRIQVSIFMSPANVHVNRVPISGVVSYVQYHVGKYLVAWHPKSSTENERNTVVIKSGNTEILLRQIAGALAKRIVNYAKAGDVVQHGQDFGFIKFGSRVDLFFPLGTKIEVTLNQVVKGNTTILARI